jgi:predicted porin
MIRTLLAVVAAGASMLAPLVRAQASDVTLYGRINLDIEVVSARQEHGENPRVLRVSSNSSQFGLRGREALRTDLAAIFQIESAIFADSGGGALARRDSYVGLESTKLGTLRIGNFFSPYDDLHLLFGNAATFTTSILSTAALWSQGGLAKATGGFDAQLPNSVRWDSPAFGGLRTAVHYSAVETENNANVMALGAFYTAGATQLAVAYERNNQVRATHEYDTAFSVAGLYTFPWMDLGAVYERLEYDTPTGSLTRDFFGVGATLPLGPGLVYAFWGRAAEGRGSAPNGTRVGGLARGPNTASEQWEISYSYPVSKRTVLYAGYVRLNNRSNASYAFNINPYPVGIGGKPEGALIGMVHFF